MRNGKKILGVIGGMGPLASQLFYKMIIEHTQGEKDQDHIDMVLLNHATMPDRTECIMNDEVDTLLLELEKDVRFLETGGVDYGVIPCNTCHVVLEELQKKTDIELINMIRVTVEQVAKIHGKGAKVGIMATTGTVKMELYQKECEKQGLIPVIPKPSNQQLVMKVIYEGIKKGGEINYDDFETVEMEFRDQECNCVIMACTELSWFKERYQLSDYFVDAMKVTAEKAILLCGKNIRRNEA